MEPLARPDCELTREPKLSVWALNLFLQSGGSLCSPLAPLVGREQGGRSEPPRIFSFAVTPGECYLGQTGRPQHMWPVSLTCGSDACTGLL